MYLVKLYKNHSDSVGVTIHSPYQDGVKLSSGQIKLKLVGVDEFSFTVNIDNPAYTIETPITSLIRITDIETNNIIFDGRVLQPTNQMDGSGMFVRSFLCESKLAYLHDSSQRFGEYHDISVRDFLTVIIDNHNKTVERHKHFKVGNVNVNNNLYRFLGYDKTYDTIKDKLLDRLGGYILLRTENDGMYLDYLENVGNTNLSKIKVGKNIRSINNDIDSTELITRLLPLGTSLEVEGSSGVSSPRLTVEEVNNGVDHLDDLDLQKQFGVIEGSVVWDDVTIATNLLARGIEYLDNQKSLIETIDVDIVDPELLSLQVGDWIDVDDGVLPLKTVNLQIIEKTIDLLLPHNPQIKLGSRKLTLSQYQSNLQRDRDNLKNIQSLVVEQVTSINNISRDIRDIEYNLNQLEAVTQEDINALNKSITELKTLVDEVKEIITISDIEQMQKDIKVNSDNILDLDTRLKILEGGSE